MLADLAYKICVDDVFHIHGIKVVSPWMKDLETFVADFLLPVSLNVVLEELVSGLIRLDWIAQIILVDCLVFSQERTDSLDARCTLQVLTIDQLLKVSIKVLDGNRIFDLDFFEDPHDDCSETF